jgi:hypothetical protein
MSYKPTLLFDFDGVIHSYVSGWKGIDVIPDPPVEGIREVLEELNKDYTIVIYSSRCSDDKGLTAMQLWGLQNRIVYTITDTKPAAFLTIDDRCICFNGDASKLVEQIKTFKHYIKKG